MKIILYCICVFLACCGCRRDDTFLELDVRSPFGFEVGGSADEVIRRGGWESKAITSAGRFADGLAGAGGERVKVPGLRFCYVGLDWESRSFIRVEGIAAEDAVEDVARNAYEKLCRAVELKFGRKPDECNTNQPLYGGVVREARVWRERRHGHSFAYRVQISQCGKYWSTGYAAEDEDLRKEAFRRAAQGNDESPY